MTFIFPRSCLSGLTLSTAGGSSSFNVDVGQAADSTNAAIINFAAAMAKTTGAWVAGGGNGSLDTGSIAASTWYHVHLIQSADASLTDILCSLSATAPSLPAGYTLFRRLGAMKTNGSFQWIAFTQLGDEFLWAVPPTDINTTVLGTTPTLFTISVPTGIQVLAITRGATRNAAVSDALVSSPDETSAAATITTGYINAINEVASVYGLVAPGYLRTNTSAQLRAVALTANTTLQMATQGWIDTRGRFA